MRKLFLLITLCFMINCVDSEHENLETTHLDKMKLDFSNMELDLPEFNFTFKVSNKEDLDKFTSIISEELFAKKDKNDQDLYGYILKMNSNVVKILPITNETENLQALRTSSCPDGWVDHGICLTQRCVKKKVTLALAPAEDTNGTYEVRVIRTSTHVRICSRVI